LRPKAQWLRHAVLAQPWVTFVSFFLSAMGGGRGVGAISIPGRPLFPSAFQLNSRRWKPKTGPMKICAAQTRPLTGDIPAKSGAGKTSVWNNQGQIVGQLNDTNEGILIFDIGTQAVVQKII
jgi:hypothetical protein